VLAVGDLTAAGTNAAWRAALVARDLGAPLRLLQPPAASPQQEASFAQLAAQIRHRVGVAAQVQALVGDFLQAAVQAAREAQLLVIATRRGNPLRALLLGTQAERLIRLCRAPVLVVKRAARASYRRVLVPVDLGEDAPAVIAAAARLSRDPRMEVLHAVAPPRPLGLRVPGMPEAALRLQRSGEAAHARAALDEVIGAAGATERGVRPAVTVGDAAATVLAREQAMRAELVVIGKRTRGLLADFFLGDVTQRVLAASRADVLVLPRERGEAAQAIAWRSA
jgi:nucleotide-binding universal stress UspA family protein